MKDKLFRKEREDDQLRLFTDPEPNWKKHWWKMPFFSMKDTLPKHQITINFLTTKDFRDFSALIGMSVSDKSKSAWYPPQEKLKPGEFYYDGPKIDSKYPVCIPSKGRADCQVTGKILTRMGISHKFFVEENEYDNYCQHIGEANVVRMPFHDLGQGSIPARNFIWDWAREREYARHWVVDDNIRSFTRISLNRRLTVYGGGFFQAMENFVDRYENIALAGPHHDGFIYDRYATLSPFMVNKRVYSCILIDTKLNYRWRGRYNEDTDLSLRVLKDGWCTLLFRSLAMHKMSTVGTKSGNAMKGGNTDNVYNEDTTRLAFAQALADLHPDVVKIVHKFNRWHQTVNYDGFKTQLKLKPGIVYEPVDDEYQMELFHRDAGKVDLDLAEHAE